MMFIMATIVLSATGTVLLANLALIEDRCVSLVLHGFTFIMLNSQYQPSRAFYFHFTGNTEVTQEECGKFEISFTS